MAAQACGLCDYVVTGKAFNVAHGSWSFQELVSQGIGAQCCSVRDVYFCKRPYYLQTIGNLKTDFAKDRFPRSCFSCTNTDSIKCANCFICRRFDMIFVVIVPSCVWACECFCFIKIELPWFFRCFCSTVSDRHGDSCALLNNTLYLCFGRLANTAENSPWFLVMTDVTWLWFNKREFVLQEHLEA